MEQEYQTKWIDEVPYCFCKDEESLEVFAKDGGWESLEEMEQEIRMQRSELIGKWFLIVAGTDGGYRIYFQ